MLVFDEPTAVLTPQEVEEFFGILRMLRDSGKGIVFITHKLREVRAVADRITVIRRGAVVGEASADATESDLASMMVGRSVELTVDKEPAAPGAPVLGIERLSVTEPSGRRLVDHVSFDVHAGEIVAVAGVQGNGQTELVEARSRWSGGTARQHSRRLKVPTILVSMKAAGPSIERST